MTTTTASLEPSLDSVKQTIHKLWDDLPLGTTKEQAVTAIAAEWHRALAAVSEDRRILALATINHGDHDRTCDWHHDTPSCPCGFRTDCKLAEKFVGAQHGQR